MFGAMPEGQNAQRAVEQKKICQPKLSVKRHKPAISKSVPEENETYAVATRGHHHELLKEISFRLRPTFHCTGSMSKLGELELLFRLYQVPVKIYKIAGERIILPTPSSSWDTLQSLFFAVPSGSLTCFIWSQEGFYLIQNFIYSTRRERNAGGEDSFLKQNVCSIKQIKA